VPVLGLCRGLQELNVAYGGTLHQKLHEVPGLQDHRDDPEQDLEQRYGPAHDVELVAGGVLARVTGERRARVNSLHGQGIDRLAPGLIVEARAPDGLVEAARGEGARSFALAVQWHPEWRWQRNPFHQALWQAFGDACRAYAGARRAA
jgi:putative glutamine amidotransferase